MRVYLSQHGFMLGWYAAKYPGRIGFLMQPYRTSPVPPLIPIAVDNGAWSDHVNGYAFNENKFMRMLDRLDDLKVRPEWIAAPDVVGDALKTRSLWDDWAPRLQKYGPVAFVIQNGANVKDVPAEAKLLFLGGSYDWKWRNVRKWAEAFPIHVGRVNSLFRLEICESAGVVSVDGTGWFRNPSKGLLELDAYLSGATKHQLNLF